MPTDPGLRHNAPDVEFDLGQIRHSHLYNADLAPVPVSGRKWGMPSFAVKFLDGSHVAPFLLGLYNYLWFGGFALAFTVYLTLRKLSPNR
jgi:cytosine/uracil/thiamine/allantoin permease